MNLSALVSLVDQSIGCAIIAPQFVPELSHRTRWYDVSINYVTCIEPTYEYAIRDHTDNQTFGMAVLVHGSFYDDTKGFHFRALFEDEQRL